MGRPLLKVGLAEGAIHANETWPRILISAVAAFEVAAASVGLPAITGISPFNPYRILKVLGRWLPLMERRVAGFEMGGSAGWMLCMFDTGRMTVCSRCIMMVRRPEEVRSEDLRAHSLRNCQPSTWMLYPRNGPDREQSVCFGNDHILHVQVLDGGAGDGICPIH